MTLFTNRGPRQMGWTRYARQSDIEDASESSNLEKHAEFVTLTFHRELYTVNFATKTYLKRVTNHKISIFANILNN